MSRKPANGTPPTADFKTLKDFNPGDRITMTSGPHNGKTGRRDHYNTGEKIMVLVKFDGSPSYTMVQATNQCIAEKVGKE